MLTVKPAKILGVDIPPMPENMVVIDPKATFTVDSKEFVSLGKNTAFEGMTLGGKVVGVKIGGTWRYWDGQFLEV
jgi:dihydroorotase